MTAATSLTKEQRQRLETVVGVIERAGVTDPDAVIKLADWTLSSGAAPANVETLGLPFAIVSRLRYAGIDTVEQLANYYPDELAQIRHIGVGKIDRIQKALQSAGYSLRGDN